MLDKNGLTEEEFLAGYDASKFERPSCTCDMFVYSQKSGSVLLVKRGGHPFIGRFALPGGFLEPHETLEEAAKRELIEETGVKTANVHQLHTFSDPDRDPRTRIVTTLFTSIVDDDYANAGDDAADAVYFRAAMKTVSKDKEREQGIITLEGPEKIEFGYTKTFIETPLYTDTVITAERHPRIAGDHGTLIATGLDFVLSCLKKS